MKSLLFSVARLTLLAATAASAIAAHAQSTPDDFESLIAVRKLADVEALARARTSANPRDDIAWWFLARAVADDSKQREALLPRVEACTVDLPQSARCHHALATLYVAEIESGGMPAGLKYASRVKSGLARAVELEPRNYVMRRDLVQFYLQAPGIAGGSLRRAREQAEDFAPVTGRPDCAGRCGAGRTDHGYRLALVYEQKGERHKAAAALEQLLSYRSTGPAVDDARKRLATLKQAATR